MIRYTPTDTHTPGPTRFERWRDKVRNEHGIEPKALPTEEKERLIGFMVDLMSTMAHDKRFRKAMIDLMKQMMKVAQKDDW